MKKENTSDILINATIKLLRNSSNDVVTARQICSEAKTNLAMINYCFKSKDDLINIAVNKIIEEDSNNYFNIYSDNAKEDLRKILYNICDVCIKYYKYSKLSVPYTLLHSEITIPYSILPHIKRHYNNKKSEEECRIIAYELTTFSQLVFLRSDDFFKYSGIDVMNDSQRHKLIDFQLDIFLGGE